MLITTPNEATEALRHYTQGHAHGALYLDNGHAVIDTQSGSDALSADVLKARALELGAVALVLWSPMATAITALRNTRQELAPEVRVLDAFLTDHVEFVSLLRRGWA